MAVRRTRRSAWVSGEARSRWAVHLRVDLGGGGVEDFDLRKCRVLRRWTLVLDRLPTVPAPTGSARLRTTRAACLCCAGTDRRPRQRDNGRRSPPSQTTRFSVLSRMASPAGFEPTAPGLGILCSIRLSYGD